MPTDVPKGELPDQVSARADRLIGRLEVLDGNMALFDVEEIRLIRFCKPCYNVIHKPVSLHG